MCIHSRAKIHARDSYVTRLQACAISCVFKTNEKFMSNFVASYKLPTALIELSLISHFPSHIVECKVLLVCCIDCCCRIYQFGFIIPTSIYVCIGKVSANGRCCVIPSHSLLIVFINDFVVVAIVAYDSDR